MKSKRFASLLSVVMVAIAGLAWLPASYAKSEAEVEAEAAQLFAKIKASAPLTTDRVTIDYISCVANAVVEVLGPPHNSYNWEMAILETDDVNAMVMPGGKMIIFEGLLKTAQDQDQLAAVIGHEIAHVTAGHTKGNMFQGKSAQIGIQVLAVLVGQGHSGASYSAYEAINQGAMYGILLPYKRSQETEADVVGLQARRLVAPAGDDVLDEVAVFDQGPRADHGVVGFVRGGLNVLGGNDAVEDAAHLFGIEHPGHFRLLGQDLGGGVDHDRAQHRLLGILLSEPGHGLVSVRPLVGAYYHAGAAATTSALPQSVGAG